MSFVDFPPRWLARLGLKIFVVNYKIDLDPNLWCCFLTNLNPELVSVDSQHVSFLIKKQDYFCGLTVVNASNNLVFKRDIWKNLNNLLNLHNIHWAFIGDFNYAFLEHNSGLICGQPPTVRSFFNKCSI